MINPPQGASAADQNKLWAPPRRPASNPSASVVIRLLADFNVQNLATLLHNKANYCQVNCVCAPFGQRMNLLLNPAADFWTEPTDALVLWTLPECAVPSFHRVISSGPYTLSGLLEEVDSFAALLDRIPDSVRTIMIPSWIVPGALDLTIGLSAANALCRMNARLADALQCNRRVILLDSNRWMTTRGRAFSSKLWYLSKTPFQAEVFQEAATDILALVEANRGFTRKILILDLDNTIWGGSVGEVGWEHLLLGGHDPIGEAFVDFQRALKRLTLRGVVLAIVSKNDESVALEAIDRNPEMVLRTQDLAGWRVNWNDKAQNIEDLLWELNLSLDSAVFLDDSPYERARVREALPQVFVPELSSDPMEYPVSLSQLRCFENPSVSVEDRNRTRMYVEDRARQKAKRGLESLDEWLAKLELHVTAATLSDENLERAAQLLNKTNQMNLRTRRMSATEFYSWAQAKGHLVLTFRVSDKFGDYGLCGVASLSFEGLNGEVIDFVLSCRVMGRGVENAMLSALLKRAKELGCRKVCAEYFPTSKNRPCKEWLQSLSGAGLDANPLRFQLLDTVQAPSHIRVDGLHA